ncbi:MAG: type II toxin-antitoxin system prevent-host-death family antitoxin [Actinomycetota bacterium]|nr:type II toxin-antitoxin system prevent-host-death family antitoxin [Actinomycetota bacterium]
MSARRVGIREAKMRLGRLIDDVGQGLDWVITDRGRPVARLTSVEAHELTTAERLSALERAGIIGPPNPKRKALPPPLPLDGGLAQSYLQEDREA